MARYRKIDPKIWHDEKFRSLTRDSQFLFIYLLTSPHSTAWGCYVLDDLYMIADTGLSKSQVEKSISELLTNRLILRCEKTRLVAFPNWFEYNPPPNVKSAAACVNGIKSLPKSPIISEYCNKSLWLREQLANRHLTCYESLVGEQEQEQEQEQEIEPPKPPKPPLVIPDFINPETWAAFCDMRKKIKKPLTDHGASLAIKKLTKMRDAGEDPNEVLEASVMNSWQGLFPQNAKGNSGVASSANTGGYAPVRPIGKDEDLYE